ncbi:MAG TPA: MEDS domain-containing protein [Kofleriaceae bacterium]|nr:MEDS domain-containing protein [Kofleriaceae bacterium]
MSTSTAAPRGGEAQTSSVPTEPDSRAHLVEFYASDDHLVDRVARYLIAGLRAGELVLAVVTEARRDGLARRLAEAGLDAAAEIAAGRLVMLDAQAALDAFTAGGEPAPARFREHIGGALDRAALGAGGERTVRAYADMVDVLWQRGEPQLALRVESLWNELATERSFTLLCAYVMGNFYRASDRESSEATSEATTSAQAGVIPAERVAALEHELAQRTRLEAALRDALAREQHAREEAERAAHFNEVFAGMLGHDLRNPLGAIAMGASYIARASTSEKITRSAARILSSTERMSRMIEQLLDFSRTRVGSALSLQPVRLDLGELATRVKEELEAIHPEGSVALELEGSAVGAWDYERLLRVLSTVIGNAIAYGTAGHPVTVRIDGRAPDRVLVSVHNAGAMPADVLAVLFEPFRGTSRHRHTQGLGLGLFIAKQIVRAHDGAIEAASGEATGTTLRISLPRGGPSRPAAGSGAQ